MYGRWLWLVIFGCSIMSANAGSVPSYEGTLIPNPPQPPASCTTVRDGYVLRGLRGDNSGDLYYLYKCHEKKGSSKHLRMWRVRVEESKPGTSPVNPIRIVNEIVLPGLYNGEPDFGFYLCSTDGTFKSDSVVIAILQSADAIVFESSMIEKVVKVVGAWKPSGDKLQSISASQLAGGCEI